MEELKKITPVARKEHRCMWCGGVIKVGEQYERSTLIYDGSIYDWINHCDCREVTSRLKMFDNADDNGLGEEGFVEQLFDYVNWAYPEEDADKIWNEKDVHSVVQRVLADWNTPKIKRKRIVADIAESEQRLRHCLSLKKDSNEAARLQLKVELLNNQLKELPE